MPGLVALFVPGFVPGLVPGGCLDLHEGLPVAVWCRGLCRVVQLQKSHFEMFIAGSI